MRVLLFLTVMLATLLHAVVVVTLVGVLRFLFTVFWSHEKTTADAARAAWNEQKSRRGAGV